MPSSIGHALAGWAVTRALGGRAAHDWPHVVAAVAPDFDILLGVARGATVDYKDRRTHSAGAALAAGAVLGGLSWLARGRFMPGGIRGSAAYASHIALDFFGKDAEEGLPLLWPFSRKLYATSHPVFRTIYSRRGHFISGLLTTRNVRKVGREIAIILPAVLLAEIIGALIRGQRIVVHMDE